MEDLLIEIRKCDTCTSHLSQGPRPILAAHPSSKIVVIGQAPGAKVHASGIPWDDKSGQNLREWMGIEQDTFYDPKKIAIVPMGFCYPGKGKSGDLPPRPECAPQWHGVLLNELKNVRLTLLIGQYAQKYYLGQKQKNNLTETVKQFEEYLPDYFVLPHPSPRNNIWRAKNPWFDKSVLPKLKQVVKQLL
ncbi:uracil-DNA glycosylase family protein [Reichenbachiella sp.]|uniref:uracil-DNA glycosylase family protein n=1 Tax=Reichenbachiella sp. TaxID=2184521 RepID=UPI003B5A3093